MMSRTNIKLGTFLLLLACIYRCQDAAPDQQSPNIILIMADDQGWGDVGYNGHPELKTPHLDDMAAEGIQFNRFYAAAPVCSPTRASCLTGRHPYRQAIYFANTGHLRQQEITLQKVLKNRGYTTGHFGKWHLGVLTNDEIDANRGGRAPEHYAPPWERDFDECFSTESKVPTWDPMITPHQSAGGTGNRVEGEHYGTYYWTGPGEKASANLEGDNSRIIMDRAIPFISRAVENQQSFFAVIWFHTPHLPTIAGPEMQEMYQSYSKDKQHYYGSITALDQQVGRLRQTLADLQVDQNTMIFYCSDNGPEGRERTGRNQGTTNGLRGRKRSLYEGGVRVPGIWLWPEGIAEHRKVNFPASTSDYLPTIMSVLDEPIKDNLPIDGMDLTALIGNAQNQPSRNNPIGFQSGKQRAWTDDQYKLYHHPDSGYQMFDLLDDIGEQKDMIKDSSLMTNSEKLWFRQACQDLDDWILSTNKSEEGQDY